MEDRHAVNLTSLDPVAGPPLEDHDDRSGEPARPRGGAHLLDECPGGARSVPPPAGRTRTHHVRCVNEKHDFQSCRGQRWRKIGRRYRENGRLDLLTPFWLTVVSWTYHSVCFLCAGILSYDIFVNQRRQPMGVMDAVFPITALYFGPFALALYRRWARAPAAGTTSARSEKAMAHTMAGAPAGGASGPDESESVQRDKPRWVVLADSPLPA
jgi:hypothetical protein